MTATPLLSQFVEEVNADFDQTLQDKAVVILTGCTGKFTVAADQVLLGSTCPRWPLENPPLVAGSKSHT